MVLLAQIEEVVVIGEEALEAGDGWTLDRVAFALLDLSFEMRALEGLAGAEERRRAGLRRLLERASVSAMRAAFELLADGRRPPPGFPDPSRTSIIDGPSIDGPFVPEFGELSRAVRGPAPG